MNVSSEVLSVLSALEFPTERTSRIVERLDRSMYTKVNKVLEAIGGVWSRKEQAHVFTEDARARVDQVIDTGEVTTRKDIGFFPTPAPLAAKLVALAGVRPGMRVLEPSAGTGRIVDAILAAKPEHVVAVERDPAMRQALMARAGTPAGHGLWVTDCEDFMDYETRYATGEIKRFGCVVMNPPFCRSGKGDHLDHVRHAHAQLEPDGILVSVLPSSVTFRRDQRHAAFRTWATSLGTIEELPDGSFKESGTSVRTVVVRLTSNATRKAPR